MTFTSWIDQQIAEAAERGAFDNLPGAGQPLPKRPENDDGMSWIREKLAREGVSADELLPPPLKLRKERQRLLDNVTGFASEQDLLASVSALNMRIAEWRRIPVGPPVHVPLVDKDAVLSQWRDARRAEPVPDPSPDPAAAGPDRQPRRQWFRRGRSRHRQN